MGDIQTLLHAIVSLASSIMFWIIICGVILVIIMENKHPVKTVAWVSILIFMPYIGLFIYFFWGQNFRKKKLINKKGYNKIQNRIINQLTQENIIKGKETDSPELIHLIYNNCKAIPFYNNNIDIYTEGKEFKEALFETIKKAEQHIHLESYIINNDTFGTELLDALIEKAKEGVQIRVIYDDVACWKVDKHYFERMKEEGIEVCSFLKVRFPLFTNKVNYRNHRKVIIIDGKIGYIGGMNIADRYLDGVPWGIWRDTHIQITGPAVYGLQNVFLKDWAFANQTLLTSQNYFPSMNTKGDNGIQIASSGPTSEWKNIEQAIVHSIYNAHRYYYIQTPYFMPSESVLNALQTAAISGIDIRIMIPQKSDSLFTAMASRSYIESLLQAGVKIFLYDAGFLHSKSIVWDDTFSIVGSANMDFRSYEQNFEASAFIYGKEIAKKLKAFYLRDQKDSIQIQLNDWLKRPKMDKLKESFCRIFSPLM